MPLDLPPTHDTATVTVEQVTVSASVSTPHVQVREPILDVSLRA